MSVNHAVSYFDSIKSNIIVNNKEKIHSYLLERTGASFLKLSFVNIKLPPNSYVEFKYGENSIQREFFNNADKAEIIIPGERVNIRVILTKEVNLDDVFSFELNSVEYESYESGGSGNGGYDDEAYFRQYGQRPYMCYAGTEIAEHSLATAAARIGKWGTCSLIGNENHLLTNVDVVINDDYLEHGEIWFNYFNRSCNRNSSINQPVRLKPGRILEINHGTRSHDGYALLTLDDFDYVNSNVKELFGGLEISEKNPSKGEDIYIPQYGNGSPGTMYIVEKLGKISSDEYYDRNANITSITSDGDGVTYQAGVPYKAFGAPIISRKSNQLVGMHRRTLDGENFGVSAKKLNAELDSFISGSNESVIGLGEVTSFNLELTPFDMKGHLIPIDLDKKGVILPFDTVKITDYENYSLIKVDAINLLTNKVFPLTFKANLVDKGYHTHIHDKNIAGKVFLKLYDFDFDLDTTRLIKFWLAFKVNDPMNNIRNYVIRAVFDYYNPHVTPFNMSADVDNNIEFLDLNLWENDELKESSVSYTIYGDDNYGFVAVYNDQGPVDLVWDKNGYSEVKVLLKNPSGDEIIVNLRGERNTNCAGYTMNSAAGCLSSNKFSRLTLSFYPEDNENLKYQHGSIYFGIIPLQAKRWKNETDFDYILVNVWLRDIFLDSEPENINPS